MKSRAVRMRWLRDVRLARDPGRWWPELAAAFAACLLYARTIEFSFVFDDHSLIGAQGPLPLGSEWLHYRPLRYASLWLDHRIGGGAPWAYHATNVALHAVAAVLVVRLVRRAGAAAPLAAACGLLFAAHPLAVEAVAYVAGRRDLLCAACGLGALVAWSSGRSTLAIAGAILAVAAKEIGILFVPLLAVASACGIGLDVRSARSPLLFTALAAITLPIAYGASGPLAPQGPASTKLYLAGLVAAHYVRNVLDPRSLSIEYPRLRCTTEACTAAGVPRALAGLAILAAGFAGAAAAAIIARRRRATTPHAAQTPGWRAFALAWVAIWLAALSFVVGAHEPGVDRHAYVLVAALAVGVGAFGAGTHARAQRVVQTAAVAAAAMLAVVAYGRIDVWRDDLALWTSALHDAPASARVHHNLAAALAERGRFARARRLLARATDIDPDYWPSHLGFAGIDCERGRFEAARMRIEEARVLGATADQLAAIERRCAELRTSR